MIRAGLFMSHARRKDTVSHCSKTQLSLVAEQLPSSLQILWSVHIQLSFFQLHGLGRSQQLSRSHIAAQLFQLVKILCGEERRNTLSSRVSRGLRHRLSHQPPQMLCRHCRLITGHHHHPSNLFALTSLHPQCNRGAHALLPIIVKNCYRVTQQATCRHPLMLCTQHNNNRRATSRTCHSYRSLKQGLVSQHRKLFRRTQSPRSSCCQYHCRDIRRTFHALLCHIVEHQRRKASTASLFHRALHLQIPRSPTQFYLPRYALCRQPP